MFNRLANRVRIDDSGFTLVELLTVILIMGLLAIVTMPAYQNQKEKGRDSQRVTDLKLIRDALEAYRIDKGYYPASSCGWDCNGYRYSYDAAGWGVLATELAPYLPEMPKDPVNSSCPPWGTDCFSYAYGNVGATAYVPQYDLTAQLESDTNSLRCAVKNYRYYFSDALWCGSYSPALYEASGRR